LARFSRSSVLEKGFHERSEKEGRCSRRMFMGQSCVEL
jgi:hypothetical protein